ncbi:MAG: putative TIM-barrel fold metal-dependent hydrolase [Gammaproteobacteria bacterium]|jgi:predicted TIM-barrel fold metal-dependent hydrolase
MFYEGAISADSHIVEPPNCYVDFIEPKFRDRAPRVVRHDSGRDQFIIEGMDSSVPFGFIDGAGIKPSERQRTLRTKTFDDVRPGAYQGLARLADMDRDGIAAEVIYASVGMVLCTHPDVAFKAACFKAYNRWLQSFCQDAPKRLFGLAMTAVTSVDDAIKDFELAKSQGHVGMMMVGDPVYEDYDHPDYDALWQCATDLEMPVCFHILTAKRGSIADAFKADRGHPLNGFMGIIRAVQDIVGLFTLGGVFERNPGLKLVSAESDAGWLAHYMYRMDHAVFNAKDDGLLKGLSKLPSDYMRANVWATFQDDWVAFKMRDLVNFERLLWANDYPHSDSTWPRSQELLAQQANDLSEVERHAILRGNVIDLFNLPLEKIPAAAQQAG